MNLGDLTARFDGLFRLAAFDEHDGWDFAFGPGERAALLERTPAGFAATFNGLMLVPRPERAQEWTGPTCSSFPSGS